MSSAYLRLLIFLLEILISACASSSPAFHMMYSAYKLNKQGDNIQGEMSAPPQILAPWKNILELHVDLVFNYVTWGGGGIRLKRQLGEN